MDQFTFCAVHRNKSIQMIDNEKKNADYEKNVEDEKIFKFLTLQQWWQLLQWGKLTRMH